MWPFKNDQPDKMQDRVEKLKAFRDIGDTFEYLGRRCVVIGHYNMYPSIGIIPFLKFHYADKNGIIHEMSVSYHEMPAIWKANQISH